MIAVLILGLLTIWLLSFGLAHLAVVALMVVVALALATAVARFAESPGETHAVV